VLTVEGLVCRYGKVEAVRELSIEVKQGELVTLIGANGAGKTTTLKAISGLLSPAAGRISFLGEDITRAEPKRILFKGDEPVHELMRTECFALCVPLVAVGDFDLLFAFALIQIGYYRAQGRARLFSVKRLARHPKASFVIIESGLEIRHQDITQFVACPEKMG